MANIKINIPSHWKAAKLGEVCSKPQYGYTTKAVKDGDIKLLRTTDITKGKINWKTVPYCLENPGDPEKYLIKDGDILISRAGSIGVSVLIHNPQKAVFASYLIRFRPLINNKFVKFYLESPIYWSNISSEKLGIAVQNINATKLKNFDFPLPSLPEQQRIVTKIEELFSELDNGIASLKKAKEQLKVYRQSVLKWAFEGRLTEQWRKENNPEPAEKLLEKIKEEKEGSNQERLEKWKKSINTWEQGGKQGKKPIKQKNQKALPSLYKEELSELPSLPKQWKWCRLENFVHEVKDGTHDTPKYVEKGIPFVTQKNITPVGFDIAKIKFISTHDHKKFYTRSNVAYGDIIISMIGVNRGMCCIVNLHDVFSIKNVGLIKHLSSSNHNKYLLYYLMSRIGQSLIQSTSKGGAQQFIGLTELRNWRFIVCSFNEQKKIAEEIESRLSVADNLEKTIDQSLQQTEALRQSILRNAFEGRLIKEYN